MKRVFGFIDNSDLERKIAIAKKTKKQQQQQHHQRQQQKIKSRAR